MNSEKEILEKDKSLKDEAVLDNVTVNDSDDLSDDEIAGLDYSQYSKAELIRLIESYSIDNNFSEANIFIKELKSNFDNIIESERGEAFDKFLNDGGEDSDFQYKMDELSQRFYYLYDELKDKIQHHFSTFEKEKEKNLAAKNVILDKLRNLISNEENSTSITLLKDLQEEWKSIGPVPSAYVKELWANYNALVERFYNNRSIYFELKELDRKKNLEAKKELCSKAESLVEHSDIIEAIKELKLLHEEYKHLGPVPKEEQEELWSRFKKASDNLYEKRNEHFKHLKSNLDENYKNKLTVIEKIEPFALFQTERIEEWKEKTQEVLNLQEEWKKAGIIPKEKAKDASKRFWSSCKAFFHNKEKFFKELEGQKVENLKHKIEICEKAEALKDNEDFVNTAKALKDLQKEWENIGPVPIKQKDAIFKRFKAACDHFFDRKRKHIADEEKDYHENLQRKLEICENIESLASAKEINMDKFHELQEEYKSIGYVPKSEIKNIQTKFKQAVDVLIKKSESETGKDKENVKLILELEAVKGGGNGSKIVRKESDINKKIAQLRTQIDRYTTNIEFLGRSKNADIMKKEIQQKIENTKMELADLLEQRKIISDLRK